ncbi:hypothetical protein ACHAXM_004382 [Skeletonema potamos]
MVADSDAEPAFVSVAERIAALQRGNSRGNNSPPIIPASPIKKRSVLADRIAAFQNSSSQGQQGQATGVKTKDDTDVYNISSSGGENIGMDANASANANAKNQDVNSEIIQFRKSGSVDSDTDGVDGDSDHVPSYTDDSYHHNYDSTRVTQESTKGSREYEINQTGNSVDNDDVDVESDVIEEVPTDEEQTDESNGEKERGARNAAAAGEPNMIETEYHYANMDEEHMLHDGNYVYSSDEPMEDIVATLDPDENVNDAREEYDDYYQTQVKEHEVVVSEMNLIDEPNLDETEDILFQANALPTMLYGTTCYWPDAPFDAKTDIVQHDQTDVILTPNANLGDARKESDCVQSQLEEQVVGVGEPIHEAGTSQHERKYISLEECTKLSSNVMRLTLRGDEVAPCDEEMAGDAEDKIDEAYTEDRSPAIRYRSYILVAFISVLTIVAAVVATSIDRNSGNEPLSSSSSTSVGVTNAMVEPSKTPTSSPSETQEPSSIQPSFVPSIKPSSHYVLIQIAIDNYVAMLQEASSRETTIPSSSPTANPTPPPSTANPVTTKPTLSITPPTSQPTTQPSHNITELSSSAPTKNPSTANPTANPTSQPSTASPSIHPSVQPSLNVTELPSTAPTANLTIPPPLSIAEVFLNETKPTQKPSMRPTPQQRKGCITNSIYDEIDTDIEQLKNGILDDETRAHFLGGIVRLSAHDFMDYDRFNETHQMGPDGCFDPFHPANAGLPDDLWCDGCLLTNLYNEKYAERQISRADFWIACANAVIRQTSVNNGLDLRDTFEWGREDSNSCQGSGSRLPSPRACSQVEDVFLTRMGLTWTDATALMGAHTLGRGDIGFSGHHGTWVQNNIEATVFDKTYYEEVFLNSWRPRNIGTATEDWTTGDGVDRVMLNTDLCLVMAIDVEGNMPCCSSSGCTGSGAGLSRCPRLPENHPRFEAFQAFEEYLGGGYPNDNQLPFYNAFRVSWRKATKVGQNNLFPLADDCN